MIRGFSEVSSSATRILRIAVFTACSNANWFSELHKDEVRLSGPFVNGTKDPVSWRSLWFRNERHSEAQVCIGVERAGIEQRSLSRAAGLSEVIERATASDFSSACNGSRACRIGLNSASLVAVPILAPFPNVTCHVVQSPGIGKLLADGVNR